AEIEEGAGWSRIARVNGQRTVSLLGDVDPRESNTMALLAQLQREFLPGLLQAHPAVAIELEGEVNESGKTQSSMMRAIGIGLIGVFVLLSFQFKSYIEPLIVMVSIPLALVGVVGGHLLMGIDLSLPSMLGFFSLAGIVVNNSILLVLFIKLQQQEGGSVREAAAQASQRRFRAILIASSTTIMGLLPIMLEPSLQAQVLVPLVVSVVFGILASVVLVLLVTPCLYVILDDFGLTVGGKER
ncbi:MAG: efflux RND transporter permease subunit, partial [Phycisphaerales bacterium JB038]